MAQQHHHEDQSCKVHFSFFKSITWLSEQTGSIWWCKWLHLLFLSPQRFCLSKTHLSGHPQPQNVQHHNWLAWFLKKHQTPACSVTLYKRRPLSLPPDPPSSAAGRTLTLVAKSVQNLANLVEFGAKVGLSCTLHTVDMFQPSITHGFVPKQEPYMEGVNPFIKNNKQRMIMFLDELGVSCTSLLNEMNVFILFNNCFYAHRTSPNCPKSRSTLERTCPGTWPRCTRCVLPIRTSCGRWATGGERSRSEAVQTRRHHAIARFNPHFFCAARAEKAAGHHGAPPAEAGSVCHVQQQQVVPHSYSHVPILPSGLLQWNAAKRSRSMCYLHHLGTPPTTTLHPVFVRRSHPSPLICHLSRSPQENYATTAAECNRCSTCTQIKNKILAPVTDSCMHNKLYFVPSDCVPESDLGTFHTSPNKGQIFWFQQVVILIAAWSVLPPTARWGNWQASSQPLFS